MRNVFVAAFIAGFALSAHPEEKGDLAGKLKEAKISLERRIAASASKETAVALGHVAEGGRGAHGLADLPAGAKGVYSRSGHPEATLLITRDASISCVSTASVRATRHDLGLQRGCLFVATEVDPHIARSC